MLKIALFAAATIYTLPTQPQTGCGITGLRANPEAQVDHSSQRKPAKAGTDHVEAQVSNGAYWTRSKVCKRQTA
jgi:hypothetical protein